MKKLCSVFALVALGAFGQLWARTTPETAWVPDDTDVLLVGHNLDKVDVAAREAWEAALKDITVFSAKDEEGLCAGHGELKDVLCMLYGLSEDGKTCTAKQFVFALTLPPAADKAKASAVRWFSRVENPALKIAELDAAVAKAQTASGDKRTITRSGEWRVVPVSVAASDGKNAKEADIGFFGYCPVKGGVLMVGAASQEEAEAIRTQKLPGLKKQNPLRAALKPVDKITTGHFRLMVRDLADWVQRYAKASGDPSESMQNFSPLVFKTHVISLAGYTKQKAFKLQLNCQMDDEKSAGEMQEMLIAWKVALTQMIFPAMLKTPQSQIGEVVKDMTCTAKGKKVGLLLSVTPEQGAKIVKEIQTLQQNITFTPNAPGGAAPDPFGALEQEDDDDGDSQLTEEEARKILDGIKVDQK